MNKSEILAFLNENPYCHMATVDGNKPRVRGMMMYKADESGIIMQTIQTKDINRELQQNKEVELCFNSKETQIRVSGQVEPVTDKAVKDAVAEQRPFLKPMIAEKGYDIVAVYRMKNGKATVWTMATNLDPKTYIDL